MHNSEGTSINAVLVITPDCPHCPPVLETFAKMVKEGTIGSLEVINAATRPEKARELGVTAAPWFQIGIFEFTGKYNEDELRNWVKLAAAESGVTDYFVHLLQNREMHNLVKTIQEHPYTLHDLLKLLDNLDTPMDIRIGVGAAIEELHEKNLLTAAVPKLIELTLSSHPQIRADACHYLGLTEHPNALLAVQGLLLDDDKEVREIAAETIALLEKNSPR